LNFFSSYLFKRFDLDIVTFKFRTDFGRRITSLLDGGFKA